MRINVWLGLAFALAGVPLANALPVFPGAGGFGQYTVAGRGGQVYRVTNLNDSGPGSLRYGVQNVSGPRVIIFDVSGVIDLASDIVIPTTAEGDYGYLTIAGQTAPPPGITLKNAGIAVRNHHVLIQHIAIRPGARQVDSRQPRLLNRDAIKIEAPPGTTTHHIVIDHMSCSWATDETVSTWSNEGSIHDVTFSNSIFSESIRRADPETLTGYGALGGRNTMDVTFMGNIMALNQSRNPLIRDTIVKAEVVNNLIYWPHHGEMGAIYIGSANPDHPNLTLFAVISGNVVIRRPGGEWEGKTFSVSTTGVYVHDKATTKLSLHMSNNHVFNPDTGVWHPTDGKPYSPEILRTGSLVYSRWTSYPFPYNRTSPMKDGPEVIERRLLGSAGKMPAFRDAIDAALVGKIKERTGAWIQRMDELGEDPWAPADVRNTRVLELPTHPNADDDNDGYTNLEEWLHGWAAYVEGRRSQPPAVTDVAQPGDYQSPGVKDGLPAFHGRLMERTTHAMSWRSGKYSDVNAWKKLARDTVRTRWLRPPPEAPWNMTALGEEDRGTHVARKIVFNVSGDSRIVAYITIPKGRGPFPAVLLLHDHGGRFHIGKEKMVRPFGVSQEIADAAVAWTNRGYAGRFLADELSKRGYVCFVTDAINWGERGGGDRDGQEVLASNLMHYGMSFAGVIAWEDVRAAEFFASLPEVDARRIAAMGHSMGGFRTWQVAAMSDHIAAGVSICWIGTLDSMMVPGMNQTRGGDAYSMLHPGLLADLDYPDIASIAAPKPMLFYNGRYDRLFPQSGVESAYKTLRTVWSSQAADDRLEMRTWNVEHTFNLQMQEAAFAWLDRMVGR